MNAFESRETSGSGNELCGGEGGTYAVPLVSLIIVNWNGKEQLESCLRSIRASTYPRLEVIVFDNGSTDGSQSAVKQRFPLVRLIENNQNIGYALANNLALNAARGEYFFLVNNDATLESDCISNLVTVASTDGRIGVLGCKVYVPGLDRTLEHAGGMIFPTGYTANRGYLEYDRGQYDETSDVDYVIGAAMMISKRVTARIGLFDPIFSLYYEDTDLCLRARRGGFRVIYVPTALVRHSHSATANKLLNAQAKLARMEKSRICFVLKNFGNFMLLHWLLLEVWMLGSFIIRPFEPESAGNVRILFESYFHAIRKLRAIMQRRSRADLVSIRVSGL